MVLSAVWCQWVVGGASTSGSSEARTRGLLSPTTTLLVCCPPSFSGGHHTYGTVSVGEMTCEDFVKMCRAPPGPPTGQRPPKGPLTCCYTAELAVRQPKTPFRVSSS